MNPAPQPAPPVQPPALPDRAPEVSAGLPHPFLRSQADWVPPALALTPEGPAISTDAWSGRHIGWYDGTGWAPLTSGTAWFRAPRWECGRLTVLVQDDPAREGGIRRTLDGRPGGPDADADPAPEQPAGLKALSLPPAARVLAVSTAPDDPARSCVLLGRGPVRRVVLLSPDPGRTLDAPVAAVGPWTSPEEVLVVIEEWPARRLHAWNTRTGDLRALLAGDSDGVVADVAAAGGRVAVTWTSPVQPRRAQLFDEAALGPDARRPRLTPDTAAGLVPPAPQTVVLTSGSGHHLPCLVQPAAGPARGTVVLLHGGPNGAHLGTWSPLADSLALHGWKVVRPNVRGSSLLDPSVRPPLPGLYGVDDVQDVADVVSALGTGPVVVGGVSYGGYLAARTALRAGVQGVFSLGGFLRMTDIADSAHPEVRGFLGALSKRIAPDEPLARTPYFIAHGREDSRIPAAALERYRDALPAGSRLLVIDDEGHGILTDAAARIVFAELFAWLDALWRRG